MSRSVNKVILIGNLGRDPEVRYASNGSAVCTVSMATTMTYRSRESKDKMEKTEWHRLVFFGRLAEIVNEYLEKGAKIYVEGRLQTREWLDKQTNEKRHTTEIVVEEMVMLERMKNGGAPRASSESSQYAASASDDNTGGGNFNKMDDDDIPF